MTKKPNAEQVPRTPLLDYFRSIFTRPRRKNWGAERLAEVDKLIANPVRLAQLFDESVTKVEREYLNYQPFYPCHHTFGLRGNTEIPHGDELRYTVDVAARLSRRRIWKVRGYSQLDFHYLDREIPLARAKPNPTQDPGSLLKVDLFLANAHDRTPVLSEIKIRKDECAFYALIQLLTQAAYAVAPSQRERLVLFGSKPNFVLGEALPKTPSFTDLYILLIDPPAEPPYIELHARAIELSDKLIADPRVASRIGCIAWINGADKLRRALALEATSVAVSRLRRPRLRLFRE